MVYESTRRVGKGGRKRARHTSLPIDHTASRPADASWLKEPWRAALQSRRHCLTTLSALSAGLGVKSLSWAAKDTSPSPAERAAHALNRLAYGPRPADAAALAQQGAGPWLEQFLAEQLEPRRLPPPAALTEKLASLEVLKLDQSELISRYREAIKAAREAKRESAKGLAVDADAANAVREKVRPLVAQAATARLARAMQSPAQLEEVLVEFWFNHFNIFAGKGPVSVLVADYEARAIRPFVLGRFRDMLGATAKHPAMLHYLDNERSVVAGYEPPRAVRRYLADKPELKARVPGGLNENYARELMELHTLGVDGGYSQRDVTELARILTGWGIDQRKALQGGTGDLFHFDAKKHDRGDKTWLGQSVAGSGQAEGERALDRLAAHPSTARHIAFKLAQAFVADEPPPSLVDRLAENFKATGGDLKAVTRTLIRSDEFWSREAAGAKFKSPYQYLISSLRAVDAPLGNPAPLLQALAQAGQPLFGAATPDGYKNTAAAWRNPEALTQRVQIATTLSSRHGVKPEALLNTLGASVSESTRKTLMSEPPGQQVALLLASPDFMKR
jgi:uncharacterized protein (DUF1800 family)